MLVSDLIQLLQKLPQDQEVWGFTADPWGAPLEYANEAFVTELSKDEDMGSLYPDLYDFDNVEDETKRKVVVIF